ncbi:MAG: ribonuclease D [Paracoccaceae bacterium]
MEIISKTKDLESFCKVASEKDFVTIDTEFIREKTYYADLCLIQMAFIAKNNETDAILIDPLSSQINLSPLFDLMQNNKVLKVFHAARQDLEIFFSLSGFIPKPFFDTQVAAMVCGFGDQISYEKLVKEFSGVTLDKSNRFSNWASRPLSVEQCTYALGDVTFLRQVYLGLKALLQSNGREAWVREEIERLADTTNYFTDPGQAWKKIKMRGGSKIFLALIKDLAEFREREAQDRNLIRRRIFRDDALLEIAAKKPTNFGDINKLRFLPKDSQKNWIGKKILEIVENVDPSTAPLLESKSTSKDDKSNQTLIELLKVLLTHCSEISGVAQKIIATSSDLREIAGEEIPNSKTLSGWRKEIFGSNALKLKNGEIGLSVKGTDVTIVNTNKLKI